MIGLGSNRLSVCRRGGMRVTQAGRGGMEWLAGGRMPSWASPYSAQATAALKAQFPTQWPTIRDYGFAHPALVPFINEDPMLVMSLIDGLGTRWLVGDETCELIIPNFIGNYPSVEIKLAFLGGTTGHIQFIRAANNQDARFALYINRPYGYVGNYNGKTNQVVQGKTDYDTTTARIERVLKLTDGQFLINGTSIYSFTPQTKTYANPEAGLIKPVQSGTGETIWISHIETKSQNDTYPHYLVPIVGQTMNGMLDIVDLEHPNYIAGSGSSDFTSSETPAS